MTAQKLIDRAQVEDYEDWTDLEPILECFNLYDYVEDPHKLIQSKAVFTYQGVNDYCSLKVYYFKGTPVCISFQVYRKSDPQIVWISKMLMMMVRSYVYNLYYASQPDTNQYMEKNENLEDYFEQIERLKGITDYD